MKSVSLICTVHAEMGLANVAELHGILVHLRPEVIFVEAPAAWSPERLAAENSDRLETAACLRYQESSQAVVVPVDLPAPGAGFFKDAEDLFGDIERAGHEYCDLIDRHSERVRLEGFPYLNSEAHSKHLSDLDEAILKAIERLGGDWASGVYRKWRETLERRDVEMVSNITRYSGENQFTRAAFLVGASHRNSIVQKSSDIHLSALSGVRWIYSDVLPHNPSLQARRP